MASFYYGTVQQFLAEDEHQVLARLELGYANRGYTRQYSEQTLTWERDLRALRQSLQRCTSQSQSAKSWGLLLEFSIPRKERRIDIVLLIRDVVVVLEAKTKSVQQAKQQVEEYALLLHYFHKVSAGHRIVPVIVSADAPDGDLVFVNHRSPFPQMATHWVAPLSRSSWDRLSTFLLGIEEIGSDQVSAEQYDCSPYFPVPSIIEAALALKSGLSIREIAHSEASEHEIESVAGGIQEIVDVARSEGQHAICFLTGVPGSGKTLVGLSLAHADVNRDSAIHFMSGNGPLVKVLQHLFTQESMRGGTRAVQARAEAKTLIENVHVFARYYTEDNLGSPSNHAVIFDEAQRAWNRAQNMKKFQRDYSEPEMLLRIMERHADWAMIVALVGGGQEINDGEAGLEEWGRALVGSTKSWVIYASPEVVEGGASTAGHRLFEAPTKNALLRTNSVLHLRTSNRSLRAEQLATWVNLVLDGESAQAASLGVTQRFPIFLSRSLTDTKVRLRAQGIGETRYGLVGSSGAGRLRAEGLEPSSSFHAEYPWEHWYLARSEDIRSSFQCEVFATEFEIQGLELDWIGVCWGGDFIWDNSQGWQLRNLRYAKESKWVSIKNPDKRRYRKNAYRVLLTRARQGMVVFVPTGDASDPTNQPSGFDATAQYLVRCGVTPLS